jgi:hypothetical protein
MNHRAILRAASLVASLVVFLLLIRSSVTQQDTTAARGTVALNSAGSGSAAPNDPDARSQTPSGSGLPSAQAAEGGGGTASTSSGGSVSGSGKGSSVLPTLSPAEIAKYDSNERDNDQESAPITPDDPTHRLSNPPPDVPPSEVQASSQTAGGDSTAAPAAPTDFTFQRFSDLGSGTASIIGETSHASNGTIVLETWNWYAAISSNSGQTWTYYNPATFFPAIYGGFCCDQVAYYDQSHDITFWVMQYGNNASGNNAIRLAWAKGKADLAAANFCHTEFTAQQLGNTYGPSGTNYDQPKFARSNEFIYLDIQRYAPAASPPAASGPTIIRVPVTAFSTYPTCNGVGYQFYIPGVYSPGFTQRAYGTMYFAGHISTSVLRIYSWPESVSYTGITSDDVTHTTYYVNYPMRCPRTGGSATSDWCQRRSFGGGFAHSDRIFTGWVANGAINFMWDSTQGTGGAGTWGTKAYPFVDVARVNETTKALINEPIMWNGSYAFVYSSAALNDRLDVAGTVMWGGGTNYENCSVFIWDGISIVPAPWELHFVASSNSDPYDTLSGDYFATRRNGFNGNTWSGSCYALRGGSANANIHPYYFWFGRVRDFHTIFAPLIRR